MKMDKVAGSKQDEYYTLGYSVMPILKYLKEGSIIWCPFDTRESAFVRIFKDRGFNVIFTHIDNGEDFFNVEVPKCDYIISNPPYSVKGKVLKKLFEIGIPFAMLVGVVGLFESRERFNLFKENQFEILYFNKRITYVKGFGDCKISVNPPFSSVYICSKILPKQICFGEVYK